MSINKITRNKTDLFKQKQFFFGEVRTIILFWYIILMAGLIGLSLPIFSKLVFWEVDRRVKESLVENINIFRSFLKEKNTSLERLDDKDLGLFFQEFLYNQIPEDDNFLIITLRDGFSDSSPKGRPDLIKDNSILLKNLSQIKTPQAGEKITTEPDLGTIIYHAEPIIINQEIKGAFIAVHTTAGEIQEAAALIKIIIQVLLVILILTFLIAWLISGKILAPLRSLIKTTRAISASDLKQRLPVYGKGEMAEVSKTFNEMLTRLELAFKSQRAFINDVSHELRTPITIIRGHLELWGNDPQEQQETIELVIDELDRMTRLVNDLLLLAKSERPDFLHKEIVDLSILTEEIYQKVIVLATRSWKLELEGEGIFKVDRQRLTQAMVNLITNSIQHTQENDTIAFGSKIDDQYVRFWVRDTGLGIAPNSQEKIFSRFVRGENSQSGTEGVGLGLSIVKVIAEAHGGWVELISELGIGSTFTVVLPRKLD